MQRVNVRAGGPAVIFANIGDPVVVTGSATVLGNNYAYIGLGEVGNDPQPRPAQWVQCPASAETHFRLKIDDGQTVQVSSGENSPVLVEFEVNYQPAPVESA